MTSSEKLRRALNHRGGPVPVDFGGTSVTGMHVTCVAGIRERYGLQKRLVKVSEPYQMLKLKYGDRLVFWGGGIDTQRTLPFGTPAQVREEVLRRCEVFSRDGGFVFDAIHNVQANTPVDNVVAMVDAVREFNGKQPAKYSGAQVR